MIATVPHINSIIVPRDIFTNLYPRPQKLLNNLGAVSALMNSNFNQAHRGNQTFCGHMPRASCSDLLTHQHVQIGGTWVQTQGTRFTHVNEINKCSENVRFEIVTQRSNRTSI